MLFRLTLLVSELDSIDLNNSSQVIGTMPLKETDIHIYGKEKYTR